MGWWLDFLNIIYIYIYTLFTYIHIFIYPCLDCWRGMKLQHEMLGPDMTWPIWNDRGRESREKQKFKQLQKEGRFLLPIRRQTWVQFYRLHVLCAMLCLWKWDSDPKTLMFWGSDGRHPLAFIGIIKHVANTTTANALSNTVRNSFVLGNWGLYTFVFPCFFRMLRIPTHCPSERLMWIDLHVWRIPRIGWRGSLQKTLS